MGYQSKQWELPEAYKNIKKYEYALVYMISEIILCRTNELELTDPEECLEARFFSNDRELHIFEQNGKMTAVEIIDDGEQQDICEKKVPLDDKFQKNGTTLSVLEYLSYDEDGQVFVKLTRLKGIE